MKATEARDKIVAAATEGRLDGFRTAQVAQLLGVSDQQVVKVLKELCDGNFRAADGRLLTYFEAEAGKRRGHGAQQSPTTRQPKAFVWFYT